MPQGMPIDKLTQCVAHRSTDRSAGYTIKERQRWRSFSPLISMTPKQRLDRALQIRAALTDLMTDEENDNYEGLDEHFQDYINDLTLDHQKTLPTLPSF